MESGARARGLVGWARGRAVGDGVSGCLVAAARVPGRLHTDGDAQRAGLRPAPTNDGAERAGRAAAGPAPTDAAEMMRGGAGCAILIGPTAIRNLRIRLKPHEM